MRTKAVVRYRKQERIQRQAGERIASGLSGDQRRILALSAEDYDAGEIARELALNKEYVGSFMSGITQNLIHEHLIPSPEWRNVLHWAADEGIIEA